MVDVFKRYAPRGDGKNNPETYAQAVIDSGIPASATIGELDDEQIAIVYLMEGAVAGSTYSYDSPELPAELTAELPLQN